MLRFDPWLRCRNLEWARRPELRPDAHDCIMVRVPRGNLPDTRLRRDEPRPYGKLPSIVRTVRHLSLSTKRSKQKASHCRSGLDTNQPHTRIRRRSVRRTRRWLASCRTSTRRNGVTLIGIGVMLGPASMIVAWACADVAAPPGLAASQCSGTPGMACRRGCRRRGSLRRPPGRPQCRARREQRRTVEL